MTALARLRSVSLGPGALGLFLCASVLAPTAAQASCGDYAFHGASPAAGMEGGTISFVTGQMSADFAPPVPGKRSCSGPGCSRNERPLPTAPAPTASERFEAWGELLDPFSVKDRTHWAHLLRDPALDPFHRACAIFHPPR
jgi:hypothetical protein